MELEMSGGLRDARRGAGCLLRFTDDHRRIFGLGRISGALR